MDPRTALKLTDKNRGLWTAQCSDAGKLLYNMLEVIQLTVEKKSNISF